VSLTGPLTHDKIIYAAPPHIMQTPGNQLYVLTYPLETTHGAQHSKLDSQPPALRLHHTAASGVGVHNPIDESLSLDIWRQLYFPSPVTKSLNYLTIQGDKLRSHVLTERHTYSCQRRLPSPCPTFSISSTATDIHPAHASTPPDEPCGHQHPSRGSRNKKPFRIVLVLAPYHRE
jgi:hypothetical protein